jgi:hypothetical protein
VLADLAPERATAPPAGDQPAATGLVVAAAAVRGAVVAVAGVLLTAGLALMVWAITPASGPDAAAALRGGVTAFALANLMPVAVDDVTLSLPPLLLTAVPAILLFVTARRGRFLPVGRYQESVAMLTTAGVYGLVVAATTRGYSAPGAVPAGWVWTAFALALVATAAGMLRAGSAWTRWLTATLPGWARLGMRGGLIGVAALLGAGALVLSCGLILRFGAAVGIAAAAAPSWLDGLGMTMLGLAYLPNAIVAAVGYVSGVGFEVGPGTYSPLATSTVELPGVPLLAAAPQHDGRTSLGLACLVVPLLVGGLVGRPAIRQLVTRADRVAAAAVAAGATGAVLAALALVAGGGVGDGRWSTIGVNAALLGPLLIVQVGAVAVMMAAVTGWRTVPWRIRDIGADPAPTRLKRSRRCRRPAAAEPAAEERKRRRGRTRRAARADPEEATAEQAPAEQATAQQPTAQQSADTPADAASDPNAPIEDPAAGEGVADSDEPAEPEPTETEPAET